MIQLTFQSNIFSCRRHQRGRNQHQCLATAVFVDDYTRLAELSDAASLRLSCQQTRLGRGLVCDADVAPRTTLVSILLSNALVITDDPSQLSVFGDKSLEALSGSLGEMPLALSDFLRSSKHRWDVRLTALFLWAKKQSSSKDARALWSLYFNTLPAADDLSPLLMYRSDEEIGALQLPSLIQEAKEQREWIEFISKSIFSLGPGSRGELASLKLVPEDPIKAMEEVFYAAALVRTRTFSEEMNGEAVTLMVPYCDLANHSFDPNARFCMSPTDKSRFEIRSIAGIDKSEEATISYGESKTSQELFRDYGFICPGNPNDRISLPPELIGSVRINGESLLAASGLRGSWTDCPLGLSEDLMATNLGYDEARIGRIRTAILSLPLSDGYGGSIKGSASDVKEKQMASSGGPLSFLSSWFSPSSSSSSSSSSRPKPRSLPSHITTATELESISKLKQAIQSDLDSLPTTLRQDQEELLQLEGQGPLVSLVNSAMRQARGGIRPSRSRLQAAMRARIEFKLQRQEAISLLQAYSDYLLSLADK